MSKHTQSGWFVAAHAWNFASVYTKEKTVCTLSISEEDSTEENQDELTAEMLVNARLIAAAPEMLEALREFMGDFVSIVTAANHNDLATIIYVAKACQKEISELLKKVEGEE